MNDSPIYISLEHGWWYISDDVAEQMVNHPPEPGTLFGLPVVDVDGKTFYPNFPTQEGDSP